MSSKRILIAPLDWGLGHATRCVPLINAFLEAGAEVLPAASGRGFHFLKKEFPQLEVLHFPGYDITYPKRGSMALHLLLAAPRILARIRDEHKELQALIREKNIDLVISDNRFGLWSGQVPCIYMTHQLRIKAPAGEELLHQLHRRYMRQYGTIWVPDFAGPENLSGDLAHSEFQLPVEFIGPLTRFGKGAAGGTRFDHDLLVLLSGPEPQRTVLEELLLAQAMQLPQKFLFVRGITESDEEKDPAPHIRFVNSLPSDELGQALLQAKTVICRSGYSTLCDLAALGKKALVIPTPGQTEQEYLAAYHAGKNHVAAQEQRNVDLKKGLSDVAQTEGLRFAMSGDALRKSVRNALSVRA